MVHRQQKLAFFYWAASSSACENIIRCIVLFVNFVCCYASNLQHGSLLILSVVMEDSQHGSLCHLSVVTQVIRSIYHNNCFICLVLKITIP